jgi:hypothetical protein
MLHACRTVHCIHESEYRSLALCPYSPLNKAEFFQTKLSTFVYHESKGINSRNESRTSPVACKGMSKRHFCCDLSSSLLSYFFLIQERIRAIEFRGLALFSHFFLLLLALLAFASMHLPRAANCGICGRSPGTPLSSWQLAKATSDSEWKDERKCCNWSHATPAK